MSIFQDGGRFRICWCHCLRSKSISVPNFVDISKLTAEIKLLPFLKNKRPPYWNSTSGFDLDHFAVICMSFGIRLPNVVKNQNTHSGIITSYPFLKMAATTAKYYFRFRICWCRCFHTVKIYQQTKFRRNISIYGWELLSFLKNKRPPYFTSTSGFGLDHFTVINGKT